METLTPNSQERMPAIPLKALRKVVKKTRDLDADTPITLEFLLMATFPSIWENVQKAMNDCYTQGYIQGKESVTQHEN